MLQQIQPIKTSPDHAKNRRLQPPSAICRFGQSQHRATEATVSGAADFLFYQTYSDRLPAIGHEARDQLEAPDTCTVLADLAALLERVDQQRGFSARLSWTHYRTLCSVENRAERLFYEQEAERSQWSQPELQRQIFSAICSGAKRCAAPSSPSP
jgi:hypothetical protein